jgi:hypothetical protein
MLCLAQSTLWRAFVDNQTGTKTAEPDQNRWKTAAIYGLVSLVMLALVVALYRAEFKRENADRVAQQEISAELEDLAGKSAGIRRAFDTLAQLDGQIDSFSLREADRSALRRSTADLREALLDTQRIILDAVSRIQRQREATAARAADISFTLVTAARADDNVGLSWQVRAGFAGVGLAVIVGVISYCLWMIAAPGTLDANRKWAKDLLNNQLVFVGGLIAGVVVK